MAPKRKETEETTPKRTTRSSSAATTKKAKTTPSRTTATAGTSGGAKKKGKALKIGDSVADVDAKLTLNDETEVSLKELCKDEGIVIFMYPRANTGGCTKQACGFRDNYEIIRKAGFQVYGMSFDKPKSQTNWKNKYSLPYSLLTDDDSGTALKAFGAFKAPKNVLRSHVVIKKGGELIDVRNGISPGDSFAEAVETVKEIK